MVDWNNIIYEKYGRSIWEIKFFRIELIGFVCWVSRFCFGINMCRSSSWHWGYCYWRWTSCGIWFYFCLLTNHLILFYIQHNLWQVCLRFRCHYNKESPFIYMKHIKHKLKPCDRFVTLVFELSTLSSSKSLSKSNFDFVWQPLIKLFTSVESL